jgi:hypothetical protein
MSALLLKLIMPSPSALKHFLLSDLTFGFQFSTQQLKAPWSWILCL